MWGFCFCVGLGVGLVTCCIVCWVWACWCCGCLLSLLAFLGPCYRLGGVCGCDSVCGLVLALGFCYWLCPFLCALKEGDYGACDQLLFMLLLVNNVVYVKADVFSFCFDRWSVPFLYEKRKEAVHLKLDIF